jgi:hypothetical protein
MALANVMNVSVFPANIGPDKTVSCPVFIPSIYTESLKFCFPATVLVIMFQFQKQESTNTRTPTCYTAKVQTPKINADVAIYETTEDGQIVFYTGWNHDPTLNCGRGSKYNTFLDAVATIEDEILEMFVSVAEPIQWVECPNSLLADINGFNLRITGHKKSYVVLFAGCQKPGPSPTTLNAAKHEALKFAIKKTLGAITALGLSSSPGISYKAGA